jgi:hypothetical protein
MTETTTEPTLLSKLVKAVSTSMERRTRSSLGMCAFLMNSGSFRLVEEIQWTGADELSTYVSEE